MVEEDLVEEALVEEDLVEEDLVEEDLVEEDLVEEEVVMAAREDPRGEGVFIAIWLTVYTKHSETSTQRCPH